MTTQRQANLNEHERNLIAETVLKIENILNGNPEETETKNKRKPLKQPSTEPEPVQFGPTQEEIMNA